MRLVSPEPVIHIIGDPKNPKDVLVAAQDRSAMFESWEMIAGRAQPELGGAETYLDVMGINYYDRNQWWNFGATIWRGDPHYRPFREIVTEVYGRYRRPLFISETGTENEDRPAWLHYIAGEVRAAVNVGVPVHGICLYPILNHPGWDDDRHCYNGLWDYPSQSGSREVYQPLADELEWQEQFPLNYHDTCNPQKPKSTGSTMFVSPQMELCFSAAATSDEPLRTSPPGLLLGGAHP